MKKLIIFDLDGVLVDACHWHYLSLNKALKEILHFEISYEDHINKYNGLPTKTKLQMFGCDIDQIERINKLKQQYTIECIERHKYIAYKQIHLLEKLSNNDYIITCATNSMYATSKRMLEVTGLIHYINNMVTNQDVKNPKPDPECYNKLIDRYNPDFAIAVEDSPIGLAAAASSRVNSIWKIHDIGQVNIQNFESIYGVLK